MDNLDSNLLTFNKIIGIINHHTPGSFYCPFTESVCSCGVHPSNWQKMSCPECYCHQERLEQPEIFNMDDDNDISSLEVARSQLLAMAESLSSLSSYNSDRLMCDDTDSDFDQNDSCSISSDDSFDSGHIAFSKFAVNLDMIESTSPDSILLNEQTHQSSSLVDKSGNQLNLVEQNVIFFNDDDSDGFEDLSPVSSRGVVYYSEDSDPKDLYRDNKNASLLSESIQKSLYHISVENNSLKEKITVFWRDYYARLTSRKAAISKAKPVIQVKELDDPTSLQLSHLPWEEKRRLQGYEEGITFVMSRRYSGSN